MLESLDTRRSTLVRTLGLIRAEMVDQGFAVTRFGDVIRVDQLLDNGLAILGGQFGAVTRDLADQALAAPWTAFLFAQQRQSSREGVLGSGRIFWRGWEDPVSVATR